ncbi:phytanoyl-CoA dioxygenase family protein [Fimbriimonas ginsengisoli]|uniref:Putative dehydrogenase n=1 Tax=Fimbriimonas ginsengisoli Gsoil 348 TaxID=661478 RepID=A0A068NS05_FIMGI|nr:phytanoyl-CoA dioxygenase family protein [Fimbriimonas ginsengisoli]AIE86107.1 putative dehydrogenase [Fimbriimonas ginsengisoli Gsoil 348]
MTLPRLTSGGLELDLSAESFGWLRDSNDAIGDLQELRTRMANDGYLFLPGFYDREEVRAVRRSICQVLEDDGLLDPDFPLEAAMAKPGISTYFRPDIANGSAARPLLERVIYGEKIMAFFSEFLGGPAMHYTFTWLRTIAPGKGTYPHCDVVYMGRGTANVYTAWTPLGDVPLEVGGLIVVEGSNRNEELRRSYCEMDVDTACQNLGGKSQTDSAGHPMFGAIGVDMPGLRKRLGGRLLTAPEYRMGDLLIFSIFTVHGSLDNSSREIRMSSDSRYQLASEPADERWIGETPPGHGGAMVREMIC